MTRIAVLLSRYSGRGALIAISMLSVPSLAQEKLPNKPLLPPGELGAWVRLGEEIVEKTTEHPLSKPFLGNDLNCTSCHLQNGRHPSAGSFLGTATAYPAWAPREQTVVTLEDRVLNCFMRSCNGVRPPLGSKVSIAIQSYITWLSQGESMRMNPQRPVGPRAVSLLAAKPDSGSLERGRALYAQRCADCHGADGKGDTDNPPVWGERSYNDGAGLAKVENLGAWLKVAMPLDDATLTEKEAIDIAVFVNSHERPRFELSAHLPPAAETGVYNGEKP
ncbi:Cytochrome c [Pirellula sp. SH-Sr6A]|uniref:c-type cytochrome n=1 Tax=Pirellula sp. SH-Sr6A TaxID=1632865 RepID=UPI00078DA286|nr:c-type cytochrome [Pirellula sp. SH-Sr6A]AMV34498.1 Cytochrome c [Pirellula sp. SH-Sr6A]